MLGHGVVSVVPHEGDNPEQGKREKGARGGGGAHPRPEKSGSATVDGEEAAGDGVDAGDRRKRKKRK